MPLPEEILAPIDGDEPAGPSLRYEPVYDELKDAREFDDPSLPQGDWEEKPKVADYKKVVKIATETLATRSKDLQIAAWLTEALIHREGFGGLRDGLDLIRELMERFWEGVHPEIDDGDLEFRAAPLEWVAGYLDGAIKHVPLNPRGHHFIDYETSRAVGYEEAMEGEREKLEARAEAIAEGKLAPEEFDAGVADADKAWYKELVGDLQGALEAIDRLEAFTDERFGDVAPSYRSLRGSLDDVGHIARQILEEKLEADPDPVEVASVEAPDPGSSGDASSSSSSSGGGGGLPPEPTSRSDAASRVAAAARFIRRESPTDPASYLMLRGFRWGELRGGGGSVDPRLLAAPPTAVRTRLKGLLLDAKWTELLDAAEDVMATEYGRGWLDLQRYVLTALEALGSDYERVQLGVRRALAGLLQEIPTLPELTLMDDAPTANRETQTWLRDSGIFDEFSDQVMEALPTTRSATAPTGRGAHDRAMERVRAGEPRKAIEILMRAAENEGSERARFLRRSEATAIMVDQGLAGVAMPILREITAEIDEHNLEEWEAADTIARPLGLLWRCIDALEEDSMEKEEIYLRVCRLDPMQGMGLSAGGGAHSPGASEPETEPDDMGHDGDA